jgi:hypothetical protein
MRSSNSELALAAVAVPPRPPPFAPLLTPRTPLPLFPPPEPLFFHFSLRASLSFPSRSHTLFHTRTPHCTQSRPLQKTRIDSHTTLQLSIPHAHHTHPRTARVCRPSPAWCFCLYFICFTLILDAFRSPRRGVTAPCGWTLLLATQPFRSIVPSVSLLLG